MDGGNGMSEASAEVDFWASKSGDGLEIEPRVSANGLLMP
jgi:hypothetical protein